MKATMTIGDHAEWELIVKPENEVEATMLAAAHKGVDVKCVVYQDGEDRSSIVVSGVGRSHVAEIPAKGRTT